MTLAFIFDHFCMIVLRLCHEGLGRAGPLAAGLEPFGGGRSKGYLGLGVLRPLGYQWNLMETDPMWHYTVDRLMACKIVPFKLPDSQVPHLPLLC